MMSILERVKSFTELFLRVMSSMNGKDGAVCDHGGLSSP